MIKLLAILGVVCVAKPEMYLDVNCLQFWETPEVYYQTREACEESAKKLGDEIIENFQKNDLLIMDFHIYCVPIDKTNV